MSRPLIFLLLLAAGGAAKERDADGVHHAFIQTGSELHYSRDVWHQDIQLTSGEK